MSEDDFFNDLSFESMNCERAEINPYSVALDECAIKGKKVFVNNDEDELLLFTKEAFKEYAKTDEESAKFNCVTDFVLIGDEYAQGISDPEELEDELNAWGIYL